ncbi:MAG: Rrf2 family transcriptional regulator [Lachnospiraceae bacterium]|nr:Rrf2 family transcriptional regulator [Lachnospiraceae bacterium]
MKISTKGRYALRIVIDLAKNSQEHCVPLKDISKRQHITIKYMEQIMPLLTKAGYVKSYRGNNGGYKLNKPAEELSAGMILRAAEGSLSPNACLDDEINTCPRCGLCDTIGFWEGLKAVVNEYTDSVSIADLVNEEKRKDKIMETFKNKQEENDE